MATNNIPEMSLTPIPQTQLTPQTGISAPASVPQTQIGTPNAPTAQGPDMGPAGSTPSQNPSAVSFSTPDVSIAPVSTIPLLTRIAGNISQLSPIQAAQIQPSSQGNNPGIGGALEAGGYSALNSALLGLPNLAAKNLAPQFYQNMQSLEAQHPTASTIGSVGGALGSFMIPGLGEVGLAGKAAEGLSGLAHAAKLGDVASGIDKLVNVAKGGEGVSKLAQGLAQGALQSVPTAITSGLTTGDWSDAAKSAALGTVVGGVAGGVLGQFAKGAPGAVDELATASDKALIDGALDINSTKAFKRFLGPSATTDQIDSAYQNSANVIRQAATQNGGLMGIKPVLKSMISDSGDWWNQFAEPFDASGYKISDPQNLDKLMSTPAVNEFNVTFGDEGQAALSKLVTQVDQSPSFVTKRGLLDTYTNAGFRADNPMPQYLGNVAKTIKGQIDDAAMSMNPDQNLVGQKQLYDALLPLKSMINQAEMKGENIFKEGSPTFVRTMMGAAMNPTGLATAAINPALGGAFIGGDILGKTVPLVANKAAAAAGQYLGPALRSEGAQNMAQGLANNAGGITSGVARGIAAATPNIVNPPSAAPAPQVPPNAQADVIGTDITNPKYEKAVTDGLAREWFNYTKGAPFAGPADPRNPLFAGWAKGMVASMTTTGQPDGQIDPQKIAPLLFNTKVQTIAYQQYAAAKQQAMQVAQQAGAATGLAGSNITGNALTNPGAAGARQQIISAMKQIGGDPAAKELNTFLTRNAANPRVIMAKIDELTKKYNPQAALALQGLGQ